MKTSKWIAQEIENRLKELRMEKQQFANMMKVQPSAVSRFVAGDHNYTLNTLVKIERVLNIKIFATPYAKKDSKEKGTKGSHI